ncbi:exocyst complex component Sec6 [Myriangium duriaei CBS 260.36]|uniref:Exocyst complex component Sec6 n=1 Tax=Myriangium duriaei CBS 260.36 TaxID=1168546 RepID=A0A9P4J3D3_9PEZI|nr:exocyst complex component Sec6 [Myriangium duriaei CBS 260.36]
MNDAEDVTSRLAELLRSPDDLDKIASLRAEFTRKKAAVDDQLRLGLKEQLEITQSGMTSIADGQRTVNLIKDEMMKIDRLCAEAQNMIKDFPFVDKIAQTHRNFAQVEQMKTHVDSFAQQLDELETLLREDDQDMETQSNLLAIHYGVTKLRDVRDQAEDQIKGSEDSSRELVQNLQLETGVTLQDHFNRLDEVVDWFDDHVGQACMNLIPLVQSGNNGLIVRLAIIVEEEEKKDKQVKALQDAQKDFKDLASRFKSMNSGQKELRGYKEKFLKAIELNAENQFDTASQAFLDDPDKLEKSVRWYFNDLNTVKLGMTNLMPRKWKIFKTYTDIYHKKMHDFLIAHIENPQLNPPHMLAIIHWVSKYYTKMEKLGVPSENLRPHVIDNRESDLVREYRQLIIKAVEEWMDRMSATDKANLVERKEGSLDVDENMCLRTKTLPDMWRMLREQLSVAASSDRPDVTEGVVDAMMRALKSKQGMLERLVDTETSGYKSATLTQAQQDSMNGLLDWLVAIANDQIACIDDHEESGITSYLVMFRRDYEPLVSPGWASLATMEMDSLRNGFVDLGTHCTALFASLLFVDVRSVFVDQIFTQSWYTQKGMGTIIATLGDYLDDYEPVVHPSLRDILIEEVADELLARYLSCISSATTTLPSIPGVTKKDRIKFRRQDPFTDKIKDDVVTVFNFFGRYEDSFAHIKDRWRAVNAFVDLIAADKGQPVVDAYVRFKTAYWDVQIAWVEAVLRTRDDYDRNMLAAVKAAAAQIQIERGPETVMSRVR